MNDLVVTATGAPKSLDPDFNLGLSLDKCEVANYFIEDILSLLCMVSKAEGGNVPGEKQMRELLMVNWVNGSEKALKEALSLIGSGDSAFTEKNLKKLDKLLDKTLTAEFADPVDKKLFPLMTKYYKKAKESLYKKGLPSVWGAIDDKATKWLYDHHMYWVYGYYNKHLSKAMSVKVAEGMAEGLGRESIGEIMHEFFNNYPGVGNRPLSYWKMFSANGMNRSRQFGLIQGWVDLGIKELEVLAVMDERTTSICFAPWTSITTTEGYKRIEEIVPGDQVLSGSGQSCTVKSSMRRSSQSWVSIRMSSGCLLTVTPEHPILTIKGWKPAGQLLKGDQLALQESSNENLCNLRQRVPEQSKGSGSEILFPRMLSYRSGQRGVDNTIMCSLRQGIPSTTLLRDSGENQALQQEMPSDGRTEGIESGSTYSEMQKMRKTIQNKTNRVSVRKRPKVLFNGMSSKSCINKLRIMWQEVQIQFMGIKTSKILFCRLLPTIKDGDQNRNVSRRNPEGIQDSIQGGSSVGKLLHRFRIATIQHSNRSRWGLLASTGTQDGINREERISNPKSGIYSRENRGIRTEVSAGEKSPEEYLRCATGITTVLEVRQIFLSVAQSAYNLEVNDDPTYVAGGVIVHNCREMNGRIIPVGRAVDQRDDLMNVDDPEDVKQISPWLKEKEVEALQGKPTKTLMGKGQIVPPYHANCRTTLVEK